MNDAEIRDLVKALLIAFDAADADAIVAAREPLDEWLLADEHLEAVA